MGTPLPPLDPVNDTLLFSAGVILLSPKPAHSQVKSKCAKRRTCTWEVAAVIGLSIVGFGFPLRYVDAPRPRETAAGVKATPSPAFVITPPEHAEPSVHDTTVAFVCSPAEGARLAATDRKLTLVLHISGDFDVNEFT